MKVYKFLFCDCIFESAYATLSLHKTKSGAYKAMRNYITIEYNKWYDERILFGKDRRFGHKFGLHQSWCIDETELLE